MSSHVDSPAFRASDGAVRTFLIHSILWNLSLFAVIRLPWIDGYVINAFVEFQKTLVAWYGTARDARIVVNSSCSGADVMALCATITLSYPVAWARRLRGAFVGIILVLILNMARIGSLYMVASRPDTLQVLHVYIWPAVLVLAMLLYVWLWTRVGQQRTGAITGEWRRFGWWSLAMLLLYAAAVPWAFTSAALHRLAVLTTTTASGLLTGLGATVQTTATVLVTQRGAFQVTQECLFTPMLPIYIAAVCSRPLSARRRTAWLLATLPIFFVLGVARLLVLALPALVADSPVTLAHGFYQLMAGAAVIVAAVHIAPVRSSGPHPTLRTMSAFIVAIAAGLLAASFWEPLLLQLAGIVQLVLPATMTALDPPGDRQGALALLPAFQMGLASGLWVALRGYRRAWLFASAVGLIALSQLAFLSGLGTLTATLGLQPHALVVRAWALLVPLAAVVSVAAHGTRFGDSTYRRFWDRVGAEFPALTGAASTDFYFENERRLIEEALPSLSGCTFLKTDLWDEAKNTRILQWVADQGARVYAIDLSAPIARQARDAFAGAALRAAVSDVRRLPFGDDTFDAIYSMGTIEHFAETEETVVELARVLKPGGRLILGVPNRYDPFLRPTMVSILYALGLYGYGYEKSYSRRALRAMLENARLDVRLESGILFVPGWIRMLDLWCHTRARALGAIPRALLRPFVWLDHHVKTVRRYGYLIASVGAKPPATASGSYAGVEYVVDARACDAEALRSLPRLQHLFTLLIADLKLHPVAPPVWHVFPGGGVTGIALLSESHLALHSYPEAGILTANLYCCRQNAEWPWEEQLRSLLGAQDVSVVVLRRG